jgi:hypothetical protein
VLVVETNELISIYIVNDPNKAEIIKNALQSEGIPCQLGGEHQGGFTGMFEIDVLVRAVECGST